MHCAICNLISDCQKAILLACTDGVIPDTSELALEAYILG